MGTSKNIFNLNSLWLARKVLAVILGRGLVHHDLKHGSLVGRLVETVKASQEVF